MKIAFVSSEIVPFASSGGLGDVSAALPGAILQRGHDIWRVMPLYRQVMEGGFRLTDTGLRLSIPVGHYLYKAEIWKADDPPPLTYFVRRDEFFDRRELYSLPERDYEDNLERFVFFQKAVVSLIDTLGLPVDIIHGNDWQCGLLPLYLKHGLQGTGRPAKEKVVFTIHNLAFQGIFPGFAYYVTNLPMSAYSIDQLEFFGNFSCIKGGIIHGDVVTTVSPTYAQEIQTEAGGAGLHGLLTTLKHKLVGILNGVDYDAWDPKHDKLIAKRYHTENLKGKEACKLDLQTTLNLDPNPATPVVGMVTRLADQKGFDILAQAMPELMDRDLQLVLLGAGQDEYQNLCHDWSTRWPEKFAMRLGFDPELAHKIEAGSDLFLMPSRFEPCGLNQMYSLRYGTIPIVHATGGLEDSIIDIGEFPGQGTGIKFRDYSAPSLMQAVDRGLTLYRNKPELSKVRQRAMKQDFSWNRSAEQYLDIYSSLMHGSP